MRQVPFLKSEIEETIPNRFRRAANQVPNNIAIETEFEKLTYLELDKISDQIATVITKKHSLDTPIVAVLMEHSPQALAAILGILKAGKSFVIFTPEMPLKKLAALWEDTLQPPILTNTKCLNIAAQISSAENIINLDKIAFESDIFDVSAVKTQPSDIAAIFYTSGSMGESKGVIWSHELILHTAYLNYQSYQISTEDKLAMFSAFGFGAAMTMSFAALLSGASLFIPNTMTHNLSGLTKWIIEKKATILSLPPINLYRQITNALSEMPPLKHIRLIILGGDALYKKDIDLYKKVFASSTVLVYRLAGSETMLMRENKFDTTTEITTDRISAGYSVPDKELLLLDDQGKEISNGEVGEIAIRSRYLSSGYWRKPDLTKKSFLDDPETPTKKIYLTGDIGRLSLDGQLEHLGRKDNMVKIRGYSIQLEVIDETLQNFKTIKEAVVVVQQTAKNKRLIAYLVPKEKTTSSIKEIRDWLSLQLPSHMMPSLYIWVDTLPKTVTGKVNRNALPSLTLDRPELDTDFIPARNDNEKKLAHIWQNILELTEVGVEDNFFELGGDSLSALEMTLEVEKSFAGTVPQSFFKQPTISHLALLLETNRLTASDQEKPSIPKLTKTQKPQATAVHKIKKLVTRRYSLNDFDRLIDILVARHIVSKPYEDAIQWSIKWSQNSLVRNFIYSRRYALFSQWMASLQNDQLQTAEAFQMNLLANMNFGLARYLSTKHKIDRSNLQVYKKSPFPYWRTLGELLDTTPMGQINEQFPIHGIEHLTRTLQQGRGVILLKFHGAPYPGRFFALERFLGTGEIPTISYRIPIRQSKRNDEPISPTLAAAMNSEIALFGQRQLQEGKIINFASDTSDLHGQRYKIILGGREYHIKAGFAELALNTGAAIIPHFKSCLPDGKILLTLGEPLQAGTGKREDQIGKLIHSYVAFINQAWATHPQSMKWEKIKHHFTLPIAKEQDQI